MLLMQFGLTSSLLSACAGLWLIIGGLGEMGAQSKGASSWANETSFAALQLRAQGSLKVGLGIGFFALACTESPQDPRKSNSFCTPETVFL